MIKLDVDIVKFKTNDKYFLQVVNEAFYHQLGLGTNAKRNIIENCIENYDGFKTERNHKNVNLHKPLIDDATDTFLGELPDITTRNKTKVEKQRISRFNQYLYVNNFNTHIFECAHYSSKCGTSFLLLYHDKGDKFTRFRALDPRFANVVYDCSVAENPLFAFNIVEIVKVGSDGKDIIKYRVYVYTDEKLYAFETKWGITFSSASTSYLFPYRCFLLNAWNIQLGKEEQKESYSIPHEYKGIPIVEFPNNYFRVGDTECVKDLIKLYSKLQNTRVGNVEDIVNYVLMIKNARVGNEEEQKDMLQMLLNNRVLPLEGENVDAKFLSNPLNQIEIETLAKSIKDNIHYICRIPDLSSVDFSQNASDTIIKIKTKPLLDLCMEKERWFTTPYIKVLDLALNFAIDYDKENIDKYAFDISQITLKYSHTLPSNDVDATNILVNLSNQGMGNPRELLGNIKAIGNVEDYIAGMEEWNDYVDKRKQKNQNNNITTNENNIEKQNGQVVSKDQQDNMTNFVLGKSKDISENKV